MDIPHNIKILLSLQNARCLHFRNHFWIFKAVPQISNIAQPIAKLRLMCN